MMMVYLEEEAEDEAARQQEQGKRRLVDVMRKDMMPWSPLTEQKKKR